MVILRQTIPLIVWTIFATKIHSFLAILVYDLEVLDIMYSLFVKELFSQQAHQSDSNSYLKAWTARLFVQAPKKILPRQEIKAIDSQENSFLNSNQQSGFK